MADSITSGGFSFPPLNYGAKLDNAGTWIAMIDHGPVDAAAEKVAYIGRLYLDGAPVTKLLSSLGGKIHFRAGASSITATGITLRVGIQDIDAVNGPPIRGDGTFDVEATISATTGIITPSGWNTVTMTSGGKTLSHNELYAVVFDAVAVGTGKTFRISGAAGSTAQVGLPAVQQFTTAWLTPAGHAPSMILETDDGTLGWFRHSLPISSVTSVAVSLGSTNDEVGLRLVLPWTSQVDGLEAVLNSNASTADFTLRLYSDPNGTPLTVTAVAFDGVQMISGLTRIDTPVNLTLTASTTYLLAFAPTSAVSVQYRQLDFANAAYKAAIPSGNTMALGSRADGAGAFSMLETSIPAGFGVRIHQINTGGGGATVTTTTTITITIAAGVLVNSGLTGGCRG